MQQFPSQLLEKAVEEFSKLPGVGRKTALRFVLHLLRKTKDDVDNFTETISAMRHNIKYCHICHNISDTDTCSICTNPHRDTSIICVVENVQDVLAIENTQQYKVILALASTMEGDTTNFYISRKLKDFKVKLTVIARGISVGDELEYTDEVTLGRSILNRTIMTT